MRRHVPRQLHHHQPSAAAVSDSDTEETSDTEDTSDDTEDTSGSDNDSRMKCVTCGDDYWARDSGTCKDCYEEATQTEEELKQEIEDLKSKVAFLRLNLSASHHCYSDVVLLAFDSDHGDGPPVPIPAHGAVLVSRSPVFKAMLENEMEESRSGTIKIGDVSYDALRAFVNYLYTAEANLDGKMACDLLVLAEKYQVEHLKAYCEKFLMSRLSWDNAVMSYVFAQQHNAKDMLDATMSLIAGNMDKLTKHEEYNELLEKDPRLVVEIYEAYFSKKVNTAPRRQKIEVTQRAFTMERIEAGLIEIRDSQIEIMRNNEIIMDSQIRTERSMELLRDSQIRLERRLEMDAERINSRNFTEQGHDMSEFPAPVAPPRLDTKSD